MVTARIDENALPAYTPPREPCRQCGRRDSRIMVIFDRTAALCSAITTIGIVARATGGGSRSARRREYEAPQQHRTARLLMLVELLGRLWPSVALERESPGGFQLVAQRFDKSDR